MVIVGGALAAALAGFGVGAQTRPAAPASQTLGPRMDFDLAAHPAARVVAPAPKMRAAAAGAGSR